MPAQGMAHTHTHTHTHTKQFGIDKQSYELGFDFIGWTPICLLLITLDPENTVRIVKYNLDWICPSYDADYDSFQNIGIHSTMIELYMDMSNRAWV